MFSKKKKNFRTILLKQSLSPELFSPRKNLFRQSQKVKSNKNSKIEFSKTKDNKHDSLNVKIKNIKNILPCKSFKLFDVNNKYENSKRPQLNKKNNYTMTSTNDTQTYKSFDFSHHKSKLNSKSNKIKYKLSIKKSLLNSFDYEAIKNNKKANNQRRIRLNKAFEKISSDDDIPKINTIKPSIKAKSSRTKIPNIKEYNNYIINKLKSNYNKNYDSSFYHDLNSDYLIKFIEKKNQYIFKKAKQYESEKKSGEFEVEQKDKVDDKNLGKVKLSNEIRDYLINQNLKSLLGKEAINFYSKKENIINFLYDINLLPNLRNNLLKQTYDSNKLNQICFIDHNSVRYLNIAKVKIQKNKDKRKTFDYIKEQIEQEKVDLSKIELDKNYTDKYDLYDMEDYLTKKKLNQSKVKIFNKKKQFYFYNTFLKLHDKRKNKNPSY